MRLGVEVHLDYDLSEINQVYWRRCLHVLVRTHPGVRRVALSISTWAVTGTSYFEPLAALDWALLDELLSRYAKLESVDISIGTRSIAPWILNVEDMRTRLAGKFSAQSRERLDIRFID